MGAALVACPAGAATLTYTSQSRTVSATANVDTLDSHSLSAPSFGPFDASVSASAFSAITTRTNSASSEQHSRLYPQSVGMTGSVSAVDNVPNGFSGSASSSSSLSTAFTLDASSPYTFDLTTAITAPPADTSYQYMLTGPSGTVFTGSGQFVTPITPLSGTLFAGNYTLNLQFVANVGTPGVFTSAGTYNAVLGVPEPTTAAFAGVIGLALRRRRRTGEWTLIHVPRAIRSRT